MQEWFRPHFHGILTLSGQPHVWSQTKVSHRWLIKLLLKQPTYFFVRCLGATNSVMFCISSWRISDVFFLALLYISCTTTMGTGGEYCGTIIHKSKEIDFKNPSVRRFLKKKCTSSLSATPKLTILRNMLTRRWKELVSGTFDFCQTTLCISWLSHSLKLFSQFRSKTSARMRFGAAAVSNTQNSGCIHGEVMPMDSETF